MLEKNFPAVSVIIPLFNAEKYIADCLKSLANQTFQDFEILIADDCSTDNSRAVVGNFYAQFGDRLTLMTLSRNSGRPGIPRNFALAEARGKYVYFLDGDDVLTKTALEDLYRVAEDFDADVVHCEKALSFNDADSKIKLQTFSVQQGEFVTKPTLETFDTAERVTGFVNKKFLWWACNKLIRRKLLVDNNILFPAVTMYEDFLFAFECLVTAKNYVRVPFAGYCYRLRNDSLSHKTIHFDESIDTLISVVNYAESFMLAQKFFVDNPQYRYAVIDFFVQERFDITENFFLESPFDFGEIYDFLCKKVFSDKPEQNVALTSYLFIAANAFKIHAKRQAAEIAELKKQLGGKSK